MSFLELGTLRDIHISLSHLFIIDDCNKNNPSAPHGLETHPKVWDNFWQLKDEKCFLFHLKTPFHSQDIKVFVLTF